MINKVEYSVNVNGFSFNAEYFKKDVDNIFIPLLEKLTLIRKQKGKRVISFLVSPPGTGKTTLSMFLASLSSNDDTLTSIQTAGLDGFHRTQQYLKSNYLDIGGKSILMNDVKGCPETFDINKLYQKLKELQQNDIKWPLYDRRLHDVIPDAALIDGEIILIEGNWLLLNEDKWKDLKLFSDYNIFIDAPEQLLQDRLINRKMLGGLSLKEAIDFYFASDQKNIMRVKNNSLPADITLELQADGQYLKKEIDNVIREK